MARPKGKIAGAFPERIVLATGYPLALGPAPYEDVRMLATPVGVEVVPLNWPIVLWAKHVPRYRLVLELVEEGTSGKTK